MEKVNQIRSSKIIPVMNDADLISEATIRVILLRFYGSNILLIPIITVGSFIKEIVPLCFIA